MTKENAKNLLTLDDLIHFGNVLKQYSSPIPKDKLKLSNDFVKCAKRDLKASKILFKKKMYPEYAYHLQQSVEKIAKAYIIALNTLPDKQIRKISHKTPKVFIKILEKEFRVFDIVKKLGAEVKTDFSDLKKIVDSPQETLNIALSKNNEIEVLLNEFEKVSKKINLKDLELNKNSVKNLNEASKYVLDNTELDKESKISFRRILRKIFRNKSVQKNVMNKKLRESSEAFIINLLGLYFLSVLTYPHESYARYPDRELTPFQYKKNSAICIYEKRLINILTQSIKVIENDNKNKKVI